MAHPKNKNSRNKPRPRPYTIRHEVDADDMKYESKHHPNESQTKSKSHDSLFISMEITASAMNHKPFPIDESFADAESLYYHLKYQSKMQKKGRKCKLFTGSRQLIIFHAELHSKGSAVYMVYIVADSSWNMIQLMRAEDLQKTYGIKKRDLPLMSRPDIKEHMLTDNEYVEKLNAFSDKFDLKKLNHFLQGNSKIIGKDKSPAQRMNEQPAIVGKSSLVKRIKNAIEQNYFQYFIYFHKKPDHFPGYSVRVLVPIEIDIRGNCIAMTFEYDRGTDALNAKKILTDEVDVLRKLRFYDPSNDFDDFSWFKNNCKFSPVEDHVAQQLHKLEVQILALMPQNQQLMTVNYRKQEAKIRALMVQNQQLMAVNYQLQNQILTAFE